MMRRARDEDRKRKKMKRRMSRPPQARRAGTEETARVAWLLQLLLSFLFWEHIHASFVGSLLSFLTLFLGSILSFFIPPRDMVTSQLLDHQTVAKDLSDQKTSRIFR